MKYLLYTRNLDTWNLAATTKAHDRAFSLIELLVVIAIMAILAAIMVVSGSALHNQALEKETKTTLQVYADCLNIYKQEKDKRDGHFQFPPSPDMVSKITGDAPGSMNALLGCFLSENTASDINHVLVVNYGYQAPPPGQTAKTNLLRAHYSQSKSGPTALTRHDGRNLWPDEESITDADMPPRWAALTSMEVLIIYLVDVPACREPFNRLPSSASNNLDGDGIVQMMGGAAGQRGLEEGYDAWGCPLMYRNSGKGNFPVIISAGEDGLFDTADDILSSEL